MPSRPTDEFLHWIRDHSDEDSPFLYVVLGLMALANGTLAAADLARGDGADILRQETGGPGDDDPGVYIALGLVSLCRLFLATCDQVPDAPLEAAGSAASAVRHAWRGVLI